MNGFAKTYCSFKKWGLYDEFPTSLVSDVYSMSIDDVEVEKCCDADDDADDYCFCVSHEPVDI